MVRGRNLSAGLDEVALGTHAYWPLVALNLLLSAYLIWRIRFHASLIHINLRIVLCYTYFTQYNLIALGRIADEANVWLLTTEDCSAGWCILLSNIICFASKLLHDTGLFLTANSDLLVLLERLIATLMPASYESKNSRIGTTIVMTFYASCFALVSGVALYNVLVEGFEIWTRHGSCQGAALYPGALMAFWWWAVGASYIGTLALIYLYRYNKRQVAHWLGSGKLSIRYQFGENVRTLRAIIPAIMLNAAFFTLGLYFVISYLIIDEYSAGIGERVADEKRQVDTKTERKNHDIATPISESFMFKFVYTFADIYGLIFAVIFILRSKSVLNILRRDLLVLLPCSNYTPQHHRYDSKSLEVSGVRSSIQLTHHNSRGRSTRSISDNTAQKAKVSDEYFKQLYGMWN